MSKSKELKKNIFTMFSKNLEFVKDNNEVVKFHPDFTNGYVCPLCFEVFFEKDLSGDLPIHLTLEHVPPDSLGGKAKTLTCNKCNSTSGIKLDKALLSYLKELDFKSLLPNSQITAGLNFDGNKINGRLRIDKDGKLNLHMDTERSNPASLQKVLDDLGPPDFAVSALSNLHQTSKKVPLRIELFNQPSIRMVDIALLRIAYLLSFSTFGANTFLNHSLYWIREQIAHPEKEVIAGPFRINSQFSEEFVGINIIRKPESLRCFLVVFYLKTKSGDRQFAVILPGPSEPGKKVYENFAEALKGQSDDGFLHYEIEHIPYQNYISNNKLAFGYHFYWQNLSPSKL